MPCTHLNVHTHAHTHTHTHTHAHTHGNVSRHAIKHLEPPDAHSLALQQPAICAVGSFAGELVVLNVTNKDDNLLGRSKVDDYFHREPITDIQCVSAFEARMSRRRVSSPVCMVRCRWVYDYYERDYQIASVSGDGKVDVVCGPVAY